MGKKEELTCLYERALDLQKTLEYLKRDLAEKGLLTKETFEKLRNYNAAFNEIAGNVLREISKL